VSLEALGLLLIAAFLHAGWNWRLKQARQRTLVMALALGLSSVVAWPVLLWIPLPQGEQWLWVLASGTLQALYVALLSRAYAVGDFSLIYPVARGAAPLFLCLWSQVWLRENLSPQGMAGILVLGGGLAILGLPSLLQSNQPNRGLALALALLVALMISGYTVVDGWAVHRMPTSSYFVAQWTLSALLVLPPLAFRLGSRALKECLKQEWPSVLAVGFGSALAYFLALCAYSLSPVAYAGAVRELSVVLAAWMGWRWGGEGGGGLRLAASVLVFLGIFLMVVGR
jgi:drug/metabolite transporter (DMT)-like permease